MSYLIGDIALASADRFPDKPAIAFKNQELNYASLEQKITAIAGGLSALGMHRGDRVGVYLGKTLDTVSCLFGVARGGGVFIPINPIFKGEQVQHIVNDSGAKILITSPERLLAMEDKLHACTHLEHLILTKAIDMDGLRQNCLTLEQLPHSDQSPPRVISADMAAILYTSGSTGKPKGVVLSHANMVAGAKSVAQYLENNSSDRILSVLPLSFDYGFSQLSTAFYVGGCAVLLDYLLPRDVLRAAAKYTITGLAAVPPLWIQLAQLPWPEQAVQSLRYITNSGGAMPKATLSALRDTLPQTKIFLMYGLTEAFRSTYLPPDQLDRRPESMGKAIPDAEVLVVRPDGGPCDDDEPGELIHRGALVSLGYWNDPERTAERFKPAPMQTGGICRQEIAVWSGDTVKRDAEGYLYFVGRHDDMIKTSGYRVSPTEIEEVIYTAAGIKEAVALGISHPILGQAIVVVAVSDGADKDSLIKHCKFHLPSYMIPAHIEWMDKLPRNPNGKIDRKSLANALAALFENTA